MKKIKLGKTVYNFVRGSVEDSIGDSVWHSVETFIWDSVRSSVRSSIWGSIEVSVWNSVRHSVGGFVYNPVFWNPVSSSIWHFIKILY